MKWPYENELGIRETVQFDVVVLGGGISGCLAALSAKAKGLKVAIVEKGSIGKKEEKEYDNRVLNPNKYLEDLLQIHGEDILNELEKMGLKNKETNSNIYDLLELKILSENLKPTLVRQLRISGIKIYDRIEAWDLLINDSKVCCGAIGMHTRTAKTMIFEAKSIIMAMSKPSRIFSFDAEVPALSENCAFQCVGSGIAMGIRNGLEIDFKNLNEYGIQINQDLTTNIAGVHVCGKQIIECDDVLSCVSGYHAGIRSGEYASSMNFVEYDHVQIVEKESRMFAPFFNTGNKTWIDFNQSISQCMNEKNLKLLRQIEMEYKNQLLCKNPHDLVRIHEVLDILEIAKMLLEKLED